MRRRSAAYTVVNVSGGDATLSSLDPRTAEQVGDILQGLGIDLSGARVAQPEASDAPDAPRRTVAQRLQALNDLREANLITREEYEAQRRAILQSLSEG